MVQNGMQSQLERMTHLVPFISLPWVLNHSTSCMELDLFRIRSQIGLKSGQFQNQERVTGLIDSLIICFECSSAKDLLKTNW